MNSDDSPYMPGSINPDELRDLNGNLVPLRPGNYTVTMGGPLHQPTKGRVYAVDDTGTMTLTDGVKPVSSLARIRSYMTHYMAMEKTQAQHDALLAVLCQPGAPWN